MISIREYVRIKPLLTERKCRELIKRLTRHAVSGAISNYPITPEQVILNESGEFMSVDTNIDSNNPHYTAPEVIYGEPPNFISRIYNLGAIFYYIATGCEPFGAYIPGTPPEQHLREKLPDPRNLNPELTLPASAMISKMMSVSPADRHANMHSFIFDMKSIKNGEWPLNAPIPITASPVSPENQMPTPQESKQRITVSSKKINSAHRRRKSKRRKISIDGFVYVAVIVGGLWAAWHFKEYWIKYVPQIESWITNKSKTIKNEQPARVQPMPAPHANTLSRPDGTFNTPAQRTSTESYKRRPGRHKPKRTATWKDPEFIRGAKIYNAAFDSYNSYCKSDRDGSPNAHILDKTEKMARTSAEIFKSCKARAPENVPIQQYIERCYRLIANCRQSKLLDMADED